MSELTIGSWNVEEEHSGEDRYTGGLNSKAIQQDVIARGWDVAVFPEGLPEGGPDTSAAHALTNAGYSLYWVNYNDNDGRKDRHALGMIAKPELVADARRVRTAGRSSIALTLHNGTDLLGVHFDDRTEQRRQKQVRGLLGLVGTSAVIVGDQNSIHGEDAWAQRLRALRGFARLIPSKDPGEWQHKLHEIGSLAQRLTHMADGGTQALLAQHGFVDADPAHTPTKTLGPLGVQLDHILYRGNVSVTTPTTVDRTANLSDHHPIQATLRI